MSGDAHGHVTKHCIISLFPWRVLPPRHLMARKKHKSKKNAHSQTTLKKQHEAFQGGMTGNTPGFLRLFSHLVVSRRCRKGAVRRCLKVRLFPWRVLPPLPANSS
jgi:hypothetical protein